MNKKLLVVHGIGNISWNGNIRIYNIRMYNIRIYKPVEVFTILD